MRLKDDSTLHSMFSLLQREHGERADTGAWTISHRSFCCLHSLQALRLPPLRFLIGWAVSGSTEWPGSTDPKTGRFAVVRMEEAPGGAGAGVVSRGGGAPPTEP